MSDAKLEELRNKCDAEIVDLINAMIKQKQERVPLIVLPRYSSDCKSEIADLLDTQFPGKSKMVQH